MSKKMNRRDFIKKAGLVAAGAVASKAFGVPYILPSGRLFAPTGSRSTQHVVYVLFAGGIRNQESVLQRYLADSQTHESLGSDTYAGNIMYNMLDGAAPTKKIAYGTGLGGQSPIPSILGQTLQSQGTLFQEVESKSLGHYGGLNALIQGNTIVSQGLKQKPVNPTIFEYLRRHAGEPASKVWFVGNGIGNSVPLLNYSLDPDYGAPYGANFFAPNVTFGDMGQDKLGNAKVYHPEDELDPVYKMKMFLDNSYKNAGNPIPSLGNTDEEKHLIKEFMKDMFEKTQAGTIANPPITDRNDARTIGYTCELLKSFKPTLTVVNLSGVDSCHSDFTQYLQSLHRADHAVGHLWDYIQTQVPEMAGNTTIICTPECGRNLSPNPITDDNGWYAYDHSDPNTARIFTLMAGPNVPAGLVVGDENNQIGYNTDNVLTIADILGIKSEVEFSGNLSFGTKSLFDRI